MADAMQKRIPDQVKGLVRMLREVREAKGLTQSDLARRLGRVQSRISEVEAGEADPRLSTAAFMAEALGQQLVLIPKDRIKEVQQLLGRGAASVQTGGAVQSVFDEVFIPDPPDEDDEHPSHGRNS
jgi:transcriptional regulator with XRE-family HTH domain